MLRSMRRYLILNGLYHSLEKQARAGLERALRHHEKRPVTRSIQATCASSSPLLPKKGAGSPKGSFLACIFDQDFSVSRGLIRRTRLGEGYRFLLAARVGGGTCTRERFKRASRRDSSRRPDEEESPAPPLFCPPFSIRRAPAACPARARSPDRSPGVCAARRAPLPSHPARRVRPRASSVLHCSSA